MAQVHGRSQCCVQCYPTNSFGDSDNGSLTVLLFQSMIPCIMVQSTYSFNYEVGRSVCMVSKLQLAVLVAQCSRFAACESDNNSRCRPLFFSHFPLPKFAAIQKRFFGRLKKPFRAIQGVIVRSFSAFAQKFGLSSSYSEECLKIINFLPFTPILKYF